MASGAIFRRAILCLNKTPKVAIVNRLPQSPKISRLVSRRGREPPRRVEHGGSAPWGINGAGGPDRRRGAGRGCGWIDRAIGCLFCQCSGQPASIQAAID
jgi:hypothetical protein